MEKKLTQNKVFRTIRNWLILAAALTAAWVLCSSLSTVGTSDTFVPMIFILAVLIVSLTTDGYFYGIVTSLASVIGVNYAFTFPYMKLNFSIYGYPVTFVTMLAVSLVISTLTTRAREQEKLRHEAGNLEVYLRVMLFEISKAFAENFLDKLGTFFDVSLLRSAYSSYGQQVFNHSHKPFGILLGVAEQNVALVRRKVIALVEHSVD